MIAMGAPSSPAPKKARARPKDRMKWLVDRGHVSAEHVAIGEFLLDLNEKRHRDGFTRVYLDRDAPGGGGGGDALSIKLTAQRKWERAMEIVGPEGEAVFTAIVIEGLTSEEASKALSIHSKAIVPLLKFTLGVLARS